MSSAATPIGKCPKCGGIRYEHLVHYCPTSVSTGWQSVQVDVPDPFAQALREIVNVLGPDYPACAGIGCDGCEAEMGEALRIARRALGLDAAS